jgi:hypothetical protein
MLEKSKIRIAAAGLLILIGSCKVQDPARVQKIMEKPCEEQVVESTQCSEFNEFREAVGFRESSNNYAAVNRFGYIGKYQFGNLALTDLGIRDYQKFIKNPKIQDEAFLALCRINKYRLRHFIEKYEGKKINGIQITESGMIASAHLVGSTAVKRYLNSNGQSITRDGNQISVENYLELFKGYNLEIEAKRSIKLEA